VVRGPRFVITVTANRFQISKVSVVKAVLRNLHIPECPAGETPPAGGVSRHDWRRMASHCTMKVPPAQTEIKQSGVL